MNATEAYEIAERIAGLNLKDFPPRNEAAVQGIAKALLHLAKQSGYELAQVLKRAGTWRRSAFRRVISDPISPESFGNYVAAEVFNHTTGNFVRLTEEIAAAGKYWDGSPNSKSASRAVELDQTARNQAKQKGGRR